jgi:GNAT superfamily N-acetyltransferase
MGSSGPFEILRFDPLRQAGVLELSEEILCREYGVARDLSGEADLRNVAVSYAEPANRFVIAVAGGAVIGAVGVLHIPPEGCELRRLYVHRDHRRLGVASAMMGEILTFVRDRAYRAMYLELRPDTREHASRFGRFGFQKAGPDDGAPRPGEFLVLRLRP